MKRYAPCIPESAVPGSMCERTDGEYYLASEVDARMAELEAALADAYSIWSHAQEDSDVADRMADVINAVLQNSAL